MSDRELLETIMYQLYRWAKQSKSGGWSTHQVEPQRKLAAQVAEHLATTATRKEENAVSLAEGILSCLNYPRGSEAQIRCLEEVGQEAERLIKADSMAAARLGEKGGS